MNKLFPDKKETMVKAKKKPVKVQVSTFLFHDQVPRIDTLIESGKYASRGHFFREAVKTQLDKEENQDGKNLQKLRQP